MKKRTIAAMLMMVAAVSSLEAAERPPEMVKVAKVSAREQSVRKRYIGTLTASLDIALVARVSGTIVKHFENGDMVKKGQLLFSIEDTTYKAAVASCKAKVAQCKAQIASAKAKIQQSAAEKKFAADNLKRISTLRKQNAVSESSFDEAVRLNASASAAYDAALAALGAAQADLQAAEAALVDANNNLSYTRITAPIDGKVGKAVISDYNYVTPGTGSLVTLVSIEPVYLNFSVSSRDFYRYFGSIEAIRKNADISVVLADGSVYEEKAFHVLLPDNRVDKKTDTIKIRAYFKDPKAKLIADSMVSVFVNLKSARAVDVPRTAILNNGKINFVYVLGEGNTVSVRPVQVGAVSGASQVITGGLREGEVIVVDGTHKVRVDRATGKGKVTPVY